MERLTQVYPKQMLTGGLDHFIIKTPDSIVVTAEEGSDEFFNQMRLHERLVEMVRVRANVVIIGPVDEDGVSIATEKVDAVQVEELQEMIRELGNEVEFGESTVDLSEVEVIKVDYKLHDPSEEGEEGGVG